MRKSCDTNAYDSSSTANSTNAEVEYAPMRAACKSRGRPRPAANATAKVYAAATRIAYTIPVPNSGSDCHMRVAEAYPEAPSAAPAFAAIFLLGSSGGLERHGRAENIPASRGKYSFGLVADRGPHGVAVTDAANIAGCHFEHTDRQAIFAAQGDGRRVHHAQVIVQEAIVAHVVQELRIRVP